MDEFWNMEKGHKQNRVRWEFEMCSHFNVGEANQEGVSDMITSQDWDIGFVRWKYSSEQGSTGRELRLPAVSK